jgi:hypothetical protein
LSKNAAPPGRLIYGSVDCRRAFGGIGRRYHSQRLRVGPESGIKAAKQIRTTGSLLD